MNSTPDTPAGLLIRVRDPPIRDTIAQWEGATIGIDLEDDSLEAQHQRL